MSNRANVWRLYLLGNKNIIHEKRKLYFNNIATFPYSISNDINSIIKRDMPRTNFSGHPSLKEKESKVIESLLHQYCQIMPCDGYMQGFAYLMYILYNVYEKDNIEHIFPDTLWSFVTIVSIIRPMIPDHDPADYKIYTQKWQKYYMKHIKYKSKRTHMWLKPFYDIICPTLTVKWLMIWFTQTFPIKDIYKIWDAIITCVPDERTKLMAIIAANVTLQHAHSIENWARESPSEIGPKLLMCRAQDADVIIEDSRQVMIRYKISIYK